VAGGRHRLDVSVVQVLGSALAAVTAAVVASFVGVAGTVAGAAVMSVVATIGTAMYTHSLDQARDRLRAVQAAQLASRRALAGPTGATLAEGPSTVGAADQSARGSTAVRGADSPWASGAVAAAAVAVFLLSMGAVSGFELLAGRPISSLLGHHGGSGTTIGRVIDGSAGKRPPALPTASPRPGPSRAPTPSAVPSEPAPSAQPSPSPSPPGQPSSSPRPSASPSSPSSSS